MDKYARDFLEVIRMFDDVGEGRGAELDNEIGKIWQSHLKEVPDDVGMVVGFLEGTDFTGGQGDKIPEEALNGDSTALQCALENCSSIGTTTWTSYQELT